MPEEIDVETIKSNLLKIQKICQESLHKINQNNNPDILLFLDKNNKEIIACCKETESAISVHKKDYMSPLNELKKMTDSISENSSNSKVSL